MADVLKRLAVVKGELTNRQRDIDRLEGRRDTLLKTLKDEYGISDVKEAEAEADRLDKELTEQERDIEAKLTELERQIK